MEPVNEQFYLDLGLNPISPKARKWLNILYAVVLVFSIIKSVVRFSANQELPDWTLIFLAISFVSSLYFINRKRWYKEGLFFVSITQDNLRYRGLKDSQVQCCLLQNIEYIHCDDDRVGFKPAGADWQYISSGQFTKEIFEHLQKAIQASTSSNTK